MITTSIKDQPLGAGLIASIILHVALILLVILGLPIFWQPEPLPEVIGIQMATRADITAAPKSAKQNDQKITKGADTLTQPQKQPPKPTVAPPPPNEKAVSAPPPPAPQAQPQPTPAAPPKEEAQIIPDKTQKPEEKKPEEKKPEQLKPEQKKPEKKPDDKPKKKDTSDQSMASLLNNVLNQAPAPDTKAEKTSKAAPPPVEAPSEGPQTQNLNDTPLSASDEGAIRGLVEKNWNLGSLAGSPGFDTLEINIHVEFNPDGTVKGRPVVLNNQPGNPYFHQAAESCIRAIMMAGQFPMPKDRPLPSVTLHFKPSEVSQ